MDNGATVMTRAALSGLETTAAYDLARAMEDGHLVEFWLGPARGVLDESTITLTWLPGAGWTEKTSTILLSEGALVNHDGLAHTITFTVADESRAEWADDLAVAVIAQHWYPAPQSFGSRYLVAWGYLTGEGRQTLGMDLLQTGQRTVGYTQYWEKTPIEAMRLGRRNLASIATVVQSSPILATPAEEAGIEYVSQNDCVANKLFDGNVDTVSVLDVIADPAVPTIGDMQTVRFFRFFGSFTRGIAPGGIPRFAEVVIGHNRTPWGKTWTGIPGMYFEGTAAVRTEAGRLKTEVVTYPDTTKGFRVTTYQSNDLTRSTWIQWIIAASTKIPLRVSLEMKAGDVPSVGKRVHLMFSDATQGHTQRYDVTPLSLGYSWQKFEFIFNSDAEYGGAKIEITTYQGESLSGDVLYEIRNLEVSEGYSDEAQAPGNAQKRLFLCFDNGAGVQACQRVAFDLTSGNPDWAIPAFGSVIFVDDIASFKAKFGDTGKTLFQMKNLQPNWFFGPATGKIKLAFATNPDRNNYNDGSLTTVDEINFAAFGWSEYQSIVRGDGTSGNPYGTGASWTQENFPHVGMLPTGGYGAGYWWLDLGAYAAPKLKLPLNIGDMRINVDDLDAYTDHGYGKIGTERIWWAGKDATALLVHERHIDGTTEANHAIGDAFIPDGFTGTYQNSLVSQTGWNVDMIKLRRKPYTPIILAGAVLVSNMVSPSDPSTGGTRWDRNPDWTVLQRWSDRQGDLDTITIDLMQLYGGPKEFRHICIVVDQMGRDIYGNPQRVKLNEVVIYEAQLAAGASGNYVSKNASDLAGAIGYLLTQRAKVPVSKLITNIKTPTIGDLPLSPTTALQAVKTLAAGGLLKIWLDAANNVNIDALPTNAKFAKPAPYISLDSSMLHDQFVLTWSAAHEVAQINVVAKLIASLRMYSASYPSLPAGLGVVEDVRDVSIFNEADAPVIAEHTFRDRNTRRRGIANVGAFPWLEVGQRILTNLSEIDASGQGTGVNFVVSSYSIQIGMDEGGPTWETSITLTEMGM